MTRLYSDAMDYTEHPRHRPNPNRGGARPDFRRFHESAMRGAPFRNGSLRLPMRGQGPLNDVMFSPLAPMPPLPPMALPPIANGHHLIVPHNGPLLSPPPRPRMSVTKGEWIPLTKLGRLVKEMKIKSLEEVFLYDLPILEPEIFEHFLGITIKEEVLAVVPTDKTLPTGERCVRFKALAVAGDSNGHVGLGVQISKEVAVAIAGASLAAKLNIIPIRRGFWSRPQALNNQMVDRPHTLPRKVNGAFGSVTVRLVPAPRASGCGSAPPVAQRILSLAGVEDAYFISHGPTLDLGFLCKATLNALRETFSYFQEEVFNITRASQNVIPDLLHGGATIEAMLHQIDLDNNSGAMFNHNRFPFAPHGTGAPQGLENERKNVNRRLIEAQIHRDLGLNLNHPDIRFDAGVFPLPVMHGLGHKPAKFVPSSKRGPQLAPIPTRKRSLIPIVAPPPEDAVVGAGGDGGGDVVHEEVDADDDAHKGIGLDNGATPLEVCLSLRPRPTQADHEASAVEDCESTAWRILAPAFVPRRQNPQDQSGDAPFTEVLINEGGVEIVDPAVQRLVDESASTNCD